MNIALPLKVRDGDRGVADGSHDSGTQGHVWAPMNHAHGKENRIFFIMNSALRS